MSIQNGFKGGFGWVAGIVVAVILLIGAIKVAGRFVNPCPACLASGKCAICGGSGEVLWCTCPNCHGKKACPQCDGNGWKWKKN